MGAEPRPRGEEAAPGYAVIEHLSRGRRLDVYDVWSLERGCRCVLKALRPDRTDEAARSMLLEEGRLLERLTHPHLVRAYEVIGDPMPAIVLETLSGRTVAHLIEAGPALSHPELAHLGLHVGSAIRYLHSNHVLHLDLKPANVVADAGRAKVIDLSVARAPGIAGPGVGTPDYMSPEQAIGGRLGEPADVWGIGLLLHEVATGEAAFAIGEGTGSIGSEAIGELGASTAAFDEDDYIQVGGRAPSLAASEELPAEFADLIDACLDPDAENRPSVATLLAELERHAELPPDERRWSNFAS